jgi:hypothetical protein
MKGVGSSRSRIGKDQQYAVIVRVVDVLGVHCDGFFLRRHGLADKSPTSSIAGAAPLMLDAMDAQPPWARARVVDFFDAGSDVK